MPTLPHGVHRRTIGHGVTAVICERTGRWTWQNPDARRIWDAALEDRLPKLVAELAARGHDPACTWSAIEQVLCDLTAQGLLQADAQGPAAQGGTAPSAPRWVRPLPPSRSSAGFGSRLLATVAIPVALLLLRFPQRHVLRLLAWLRHLPEAQPARIQILHQAVTKVRPAWWPGRIACLETSLATVLATALYGRRTYWVLGSRPLPNEAHAWVSTREGALGLDDDNPVRPWVPVLTAPPPERANHEAKS